MKVWLDIKGVETSNLFFSTVSLSLIISFEILTPSQ